MLRTPDHGQSWPTKSRQVAKPRNASLARPGTVHPRLIDNLCQSVLLVCGPPTPSYRSTILLACRQRVIALQSCRHPCGNHRVWSRHARSPTSLSSDTKGTSVLGPKSGVHVLRICSLLMSVSIVWCAASPSRMHITPHSSAPITGVKSCRNGETFTWRHSSPRHVYITDQGSVYLTHGLDDFSRFSTHRSSQSLLLCYSSLL